MDLWRLAARRRRRPAPDLARRRRRRPTWEPIAVPGHWRSTPAFADNDAPLLYRTAFEHARPEPGARLWLLLDGLFYQGDVWLDGTTSATPRATSSPTPSRSPTRWCDRTEHQLGVEVTCNRPSDRSSKRNITGVVPARGRRRPDLEPRGHLAAGADRAHRAGPHPPPARPLPRGHRGARRRRHPGGARRRRVHRGDASHSSVGEVDHVDERNLAAGENQVEWTITVARARGAGGPTRSATSRCTTVAVAVHLAGRAP